MYRNQERRTLTGFSKAGSSAVTPTEMPSYDIENHQGVEANRAICRRAREGPKSSHSFSTQPGTTQDSPNPSINLMSTNMDQ